MSAKATGIHLLAVSANGKYFATGGHDCGVRIYNIKKRKVITTMLFQPKRSFVFCAILKECNIFCSMLGHYRLVSTNQQLCVSTRRCQRCWSCMLIKEYVSVPQPKQEEVHLAYPCFIFTTTCEMDSFNAIQRYIERLAFPELK